MKTEVPMLVQLYLQTIFNVDSSAPDYNPASDMNLIFDNLASGLVKSLMANAIVSNTTDLSQALLYPLKNMFSGELMEIDTDKFAQAFKFNTSQEELSRLMETVLSSTDSKHIRLIYWL